MITSGSRDDGPPANQPIGAATSNPTVQPKPEPAQIAALASGSDKPMARAALFGTLWMMVSAVAGKGLGLLAQLILAALLTKDEFGVYAIALSLMTAATVLRDGGIRQLLVQRSGEYDSLIGPITWMALTFNVITALILVGMGPIAAIVYDRTDLMYILAIMGLGVVLSTPAAVLSSRLLIELRFRELAWMGVASSFLRYGSSVVMAYFGFGALSFVLPIPLVGILEWIWLKTLNPDKVWRQSAQVGRWMGLIKDVRWILIGSLGTALINMGNYSVVGLFVEKSIVGVYFFAYQIVVQVGVLVSANINQVLFPIFSGMQDPARQRSAVGRAIRQLMLAATPLGMALVPMFPGIEMALWNGRWADAVKTVMIIAAFYPISVVIAVPYAALQASGKFKAWALLLIALGAFIMFAGAAGARFGGTADSIALFSSVALALGSLAFTWLGLRHLRFTITHIAMMTLPAWVIGLAGAGVGLIVNTQLELLAAQWPAAILSGRAGAVLRAVAAGASFSIVYGLLARIVMPAAVADAASMLPSRFRPLARRFLLLKQPAAPITTPP